MEMRAMTLMLTVRNCCQGKRGTATIEYAFLMFLIVLIFLAMSGYITRAFNSRWKQSADTIGYGLQYEPGNTVITYPEGKTTL
jgi:hypothetical protein